MRATWQLAGRRDADEVDERLEPGTESDKEEHNAQAAGIKATRAGAGPTSLRQSATLGQLR
jgi:hypothetical protein